MNGAHPSPTHHTVALRIIAFDGVLPQQNVPSCSAAQSRVVVTESAGSVRRFVSVGCLASGVAVLGCVAEGGGLGGFGWWVEVVVVAEGAGDGGPGVGQRDGLGGGEVVEDEFVDVVGVLRGDGFEVVAAGGGELGVGDATVVSAGAGFDVASGEEVADAMGEATG